MMFEKAIDFYKHKKADEVLEETPAPELDKFITPELAVYIAKNNIIEFTDADLEFLAKKAAEKPDCAFDFARSIDIEVLKNPIIYEYVLEALADDPGLACCIAVDRELYVKDRDVFMHFLDVIITDPFVAHRCDYFYHAEDHELVRKLASSALNSPENAYKFARGKPVQRDEELLESLVTTFLSEPRLVNEFYREFSQTLSPNMLQILASEVIEYPSGEICRFVRNLTEEQRDPELLRYVASKAGSSCEAYNLAINLPEINEDEDLLNILVEKAAEDSFYAEKFFTACPSAFVDKDARLVLASGIATSPQYAFELIKNNMQIRTDKPVIDILIEGMKKSPGISYHFSKQFPKLREDYFKGLAESVSIDPRLSYYFAKEIPDARADKEILKILAKGASCNSRYVKLFKQHVPEAQNIEIFKILDGEQMYLGWTNV